jgi:hypothetical protein
VVVLTRKDKLLKWIMVIANLSRRDMRAALGFRSAINIKHEGPEGRPTEAIAERHLDKGNLNPKFKPETPMNNPAFLVSKRAVAVKEEQKQNQQNQDQAQNQGENKG